MATTTSLLWTALPNGGGSGAFKLSCYVAPRLEGAGATGLLQDYDLGNWPTKLTALLSIPGAVKVELGPGGPVVPAQIPPAYLAGLDAVLWDDVFPPGMTQVVPRVFQDHSKRWIRSFSVRPLEAYIQGLYDAIANASPKTFPDLKGTTPVTELTGAMGRALGLMEKGLPPPRDPQRPKHYDPVPQRGRATHPDAALEAELDSLAATLGVPHIPLGELFRAYRFYRRGNHLPYMAKMKPHNPALISDRPVEPKFDFHKAMAALGDHPFLLRKLGLIVDCVLPVPIDVLGKFDLLQAVVLPQPSIMDLTPWTKFMVGGPVGFRALPRNGSDLGLAMLRLDKKEVFDVIQTDPDGNVIKVFDYAVNMNKVRSDLLAQKAKNPEAKSSKEPEETSLPALRSGGLMVTRLDRDNKVWDHLAVQRSNESNPDAAVLYADDVLRGYRVDVLYKGNWHSLCRWGGEYQIAGKKIAQPVPDEGYLKAESATSDPEPAVGPTQPDLYLHETMVAWRNWSLVARQPGKTIVAVPLPDKRQQETMLHKDNEPGAGFAVASNFKPEPKSLPPLRYGEWYRLRARTVDLAGNSLAPPPSSTFPAPDDDQAPVGFHESAPIRYLRFDPVPAPATVLTGKVTPGESVETMVIRNRSTFMPEAFPPSLMIDETALFNPTNARWVAPPKSSVGEAEAHGTFDALFSTPEVAFTILAKESGSFDDYVPGNTKLIDVDGNEVGYPPTGTYVKGDPLPDGVYLIHTEDPVALPYLPDALAHGVAFMPQDGAGVVHHKAFGGGAWPDRQPFKLVLSESAVASPVFELAGSPAGVKLPRGEMLRVRYASAIVEPDSESAGELDLMGRWRGMSAAGQAATVGNGFQHWMLTPWRTLTLVHAVEKPMEDPKLVKLSVTRDPGDTFVYLRNGHCLLHSPSTGEIELRGRWDEHIDDPLDEAGPQVLPKDGHVLDRKVDYGENPVQIPSNPNLEQPKHEFGDTKHRFVDYRTIGTTRYREYFPHNLTGYEDPATKKKLITVEGPDIEMNVRSSARPLPPEVLYIIPTFKWIDTPSGRQRQGRGLRIYLQRGWFSSGVGELLGVAMMPSGIFTAATAEIMREYVSLWGSDPIFDKEGPAAAINPTHFAHDPAFPDTAPVLPAGENILLAERNLRIRVMGLRPIYDTERRLWHVDVHMLPTNAYNTFVRFALCRYQPDSLPDLEISRVVRAEFAQLLADRTASLSYAANTINITLSGPSTLNKLGHRWNGDFSDVRTADQGPGPVTPLAAPPGNVPGPVEPPIVLPPTLVSNPQAGSGRMVVAQIEWRGKGGTGDLGWEPLDGGVRLSPFTEFFGGSDFVFWKGVVRWPRPGTPQNRDYRLVLREMEIFETDSDVAETLPVSNPTGKPVRSRLVYLDIFPLADS